MTERTRGEMIRRAFEIAATGEQAHKIAAQLEKEILPYFKGDLEAMVTAMRESSGRTYQGTKPSIWASIANIDIARPEGQAGSALTAMAHKRDFPPPAERPAPAICLG